MHKTPGAFQSADKLWIQLCGKRLFHACHSCRKDTSSPQTKFRSYSQGNRFNIFSETRELTRPNPLNGAGSLREGNPVENMDAHYVYVLLSLTYKGCYLKNEMGLEQWRESKQYCGT
ncbi:hypothetical protein L1987_08768 [Smallanthus sonchifolius]|uniref:Uncharacterized protein n=1 Tax=Smallanthus sonchifolius TaxID=185202 RepID=A0ACB9JNH6_9ASTR|nr:hypothetical protein L1987_08768 [Smallanthus sonchifolius]